MGFVGGLGFRVLGLGFKVLGLGFRLIEARGLPPRTDMEARGLVFKERLFEDSSCS